MIGEENILVPQWARKQHLEKNPKCEWICPHTHLPNLGETEKQSSSSNNLKDGILEIAIKWREAVERLEKIDGKLPSEYLEDATLNLILDTILASPEMQLETVPPDFEKQLPDRQKQMDYKSNMWARNDVRKASRAMLEGMKNE